MLPNMDLRRFVIGSLLISLIACRSREEPNLATKRPLFFVDCSISGEESSEVVVIRVQFRKGGPNGRPALTDSTSAVFLDEAALEKDSARYSGAYYETSRPAAAFTGSHTLAFTDSTGRTTVYRFDYVPFRITPDVGSNIQTEPLLLKLTPAPKKEANITLLLTDTAFNNEDVNLRLALSDSSLKISENMWQKLKPGPVIMEIVREENIAMDKETGYAGRIVIIYGLKREFVTTAKPE